MSWMRRKLARARGSATALLSALSVLAVIGTALVGLSQAANASPATNESTVAVDAAAVAAAPSCVRVRHTVGNVTQTVYVKNNCHRTVSWLVKINGDDGPCKITRPGHEGKFKWTRFAAFQGIKWNCI